MSHEDFTLQHRTIGKVAAWGVFFTWGDIRCYNSSRISFSQIASRPNR